VNIKTLIVSVALGAFLSACGGPPEEIADNAGSTEQPYFGKSEQGVCEGWDSGARICTWKCTSSGPWIWSTQTLSWGECTPYATNFCGRTPYAVCWSRYRT
jgi:hypothetical protein